MSVVTLSTGEQVHLTDRYTRKAQKAYNLALNARYVEDKGKLSVARDIPVESFNLANEAALLVMVEKIVLGASENPVTQAWIEDLVIDDFDKLCDAINAVKNRKDKKKS